MGHVHFGKFGQSPNAKAMIKGRPAASEGTYVPGASFVCSMASEMALAAKLRPVCLSENVLFIAVW